MPTIQGSVVIAASTTVDNLLLGSQFEFMPFNGAVRFGLVQDTNGSILCDVYSGQDVLMETGLVSTQNRIPINPDDFNLRDVAAMGERLKIRARNTAAANRTIFWAVECIPIAMGRRRRR